MLKNTECILNSKMHIALTQYVLSLTVVEVFVSLKTKMFSNFKLTSETSFCLFKREKLAKQRWKHRVHTFEY